MERYWVANGILASNECGGLVKYADAQRALDAERARVKELEAELEEYRSIAEQQGASKAVSQLATLQAQLRQVEGERDTARHRVDELEAREIDVEILQGDLTTLRQFGEDARRYRRLQVLGCAPSTSKQLGNGTVLCFTNLDEFVDADLKAVPSRGEAAQDAGKEDVSHE